MGRTWEARWWRLGEGNGEGGPVDGKEDETYFVRSISRGA